ncbi:hemerythrin domain-containing protein [Nocardia violaceofusca]|uniref:hemerythrin domain-containing protein n=1 Tax=Nocardia violaceofusca TaxID=941182 RepID=UPI0007A3E433|nr:hemerythrin domain-containing protein [Nocardia violaceofusca]
MSTAVAPTRPDTFDMLVVHNAFRSHFRALPGLVARVDAGEVERARQLAAFLDELCTGLHEHHTGEDELMWPLLLERAPMHAGAILRMEEQHERIAELVRRARRDADEFTTAASASVRDRLAETLRTLAAALDEHLAEEERQVLAVVEEVMTVAEWRALGERGRAQMPRNRQLVFLGFMMHTASESQRRKLLAEMPPAARLAWRVLGRRGFAREYRAIYRRDPEW